MAKKPRTKKNYPDEAITDGMTDAQKSKAKGAKFSRLASLRVTKAVAAIGNIGNLSGRTYVHTADQVTAIINYLKDAVKSVEARFAAPGTTTKDTIKI
jgi:hypothetical protein